MPTVQPATLLNKTLRLPPSPIGSVVGEGNDALSKLGLLAVHGHNVYAEFVNGPSEICSILLTTDMGWSQQEIAKE